MEELNEAPGKTTPKTEYPKTKQPFPSVPEIVTPVPLQVLHPSAPPGIEWKKPSTSPGNRKRISKTYEKLDI